LTLDPAQRAVYDGILRKYDQKLSSSGAVFTDLRKAANHPLLLRSELRYDAKKKKKIALALWRSGHFGAAASKEMVQKEIDTYSDLDLHELCVDHKPLRKFQLPNDALFEASAKCQKLRTFLPQLKAEGHKILLFSQWVRLLDLLEALCDELDLRSCRLDGATDVATRQSVVDDFNNADAYDVFLLSTRAGGLGINLTAATAVVLHDVDFNPEVDRQAEDRAHRMGQSKPVFVYRMVADETVDKAIDDLATRKKRLNDSMNSGFVLNDNGSAANGQQKKLLHDILQKSLRDFRDRRQGKDGSPSAPELLSSAPMELDDDDEDDDKDDWLDDSDDDDDGRAAATTKQPTLPPTGPTPPTPDKPPRQ